MSMIKVVIVEDDERIAELHQFFIAQLDNFEVIGIAANLTTAEQLIIAAKPDLVIIDNYLPDGLGVELVQRCLVLQPKPECIVVTAANDANTVHLAHRYGAFDYLVKPVNYTRLQASLLRLMKMKQLVDSQKMVKQSELDGIFHATELVVDEVSGVDEFTLQQVVSLFPHGHSEHTATSVAALLGVSKSTARRYLDKAVERGDLYAFLAHGKVGRPTRCYRNKPFAV
ncbi:transcriptional regulator [Vibrio vulnificus]|nr:transcriptional regulator [Vibrio vulnificus]HAT8531939.1 response regulator [Vibrio vulnificus]